MGEPASGGVVSSVGSDVEVLGNNINPPFGIVRVGRKAKNRNGSTNSAIVESAASSSVNGQIAGPGSGSNKRTRKVVQNPEDFVVGDGEEGTGETDEVNEAENVLDPVHLDAGEEGSCTIKRYGGCTSDEEDDASSGPAKKIKC